LFNYFDQEIVLKKSSLSLALFFIFNLNGCSENNTNSQSAIISAAQSVDTKRATAIVRVSRANPENATALGIEVGYANRAGVKNALNGKIKLSEIELDSGLIMLSGDGDAGVPGVQSVIIMIDKKTDVVQIIILTMEKDPVTIANNLAKKYTVKENKIDSFMGNGSAKYEKGDTEIRLEAPHLSFVMNVSYATKAFWKHVSDLGNQQINDDKARLSDGL